MIETAVDTELEPAPPPKTRGWVKAILIVICALIAAMWVYAFVFAPKSGVYFVTEKAWRTSADQICASAEQQRLALVDTSEGYISNPTHAQMEFSDLDLVLSGHEDGINMIEVGAAEVSEATLVEATLGGS